MTKLIALIAAVVIPGGAALAYIFGRSKAGKAADRARVTRAYHKSINNVKSAYTGTIRYFSQLFSQKNQAQQAA